jgi:hypothetical protein
MPFSSSSVGRDRGRKRVIILRGENIDGMARSTVSMPHPSSAIDTPGIATSTTPATSWPAERDMKGLCFER